MECQVGVKCGCLCVESGILRSTNSVLFEDQGENQNTNRSISRYWWDTMGISTSDSLLDRFVLPDKDEYMESPKCNPHGRRETTFGGILARVTIRVAHIRM